VDFFPYAVSPPQYESPSAVQSDSSDIQYRSTRCPAPHRPIPFFPLFLVFSRFFAGFFFRSCLLSYIHVEVQWLYRLRLSFGVLGLFIGFMFLFDKAPSPGQEEPVQVSLFGKDSSPSSGYSQLGFLPPLSALPLSCFLLDFLAGYPATSLWFQRDIISCSMRLDVPHEGGWADP